jgi:hypothetical protein
MKENQTANQIKVSQNIPLTPRRVRQILNTSPFLKYQKRKAQPNLTRLHIASRLLWASEKVTWGQKWREVLFSDEKKFNLDGPDGNQYYWHDLRKEPQYYSKRASGGGSVMVWAAFGYGGKSSIVFLNGRQNSQDYVRVLENHLLPVGEQICGPNWIFQQDNASIHTSRFTKNWFEANNVRVMEWASKSPDLNPIENLWGILVRLVYSNGRQFNSIPELRAEIVRSWDLITELQLKTLADSMTKRMIEVLKKNGKFIGY